MDTWIIVIGYAIAVLLNIAVVAQVRDAAVKKGKEFLSSGRFAVFFVFCLCFLEQLVVGKFEALQNAEALTKLIESAWIMSGATLGTHITGKTLFGR